MNTILGEQLLKAQSVKNNDINSYVWKNARNNNNEQEEIRLVDASEEQLRKFYDHCMSMLYNEDHVKPGRKVLLDIINRQRLCCNAELFLRWLENTYDVSESRQRIPRAKFMEMIRNFKQNNPEWPKDAPVSDMADGIPYEFRDLPLTYVIEGCIGRLGNFDKSHITLRFITTKLGLWFTPQEMSEFNQEAKKIIGKGHEITPSELNQLRIDIVKTRCKIPNDVKVIVKDNKILNFKEFRALIMLQSKNYSRLTNDQLVILRDKGLFVLEEEVHKHIEQWENIISQLKAVAKYKGFEL